jgi:hypothetical protein
MQSATTVKPRETPMANLITLGTFLGTGTFAGCV